MQKLSNLGIATGAFIGEHDDWGASVAKAAAMGYRHLELTAIRLERLDQLLPFLAEQPAALDPFERVRSTLRPLRRVDRPIASSSH